MSGLLQEQGLSRLSRLLSPPLPLFAFWSSTVGMSSTMMGKTVAVETQLSSYFILHRIHVKNEIYIIVNHGEIFLCWNFIAP